MELTRTGIIKLLEARKLAEEMKMISMDLPLSADTMDLAITLNNQRQMVINVLMEMIGAIYSIQTDLDNGNIVWPMTELDELVNLAKDAGLTNSKEFVNNEWHIRHGVSDHYTMMNIDLDMVKKD